MPDVKRGQVPTSSSDCLAPQPCGLLVVRIHIDGANSRDSHGPLSGSRCDRFVGLLSYRAITNCRTQTHLLELH